MYETCVHNYGRGNCTYEINIWSKITDPNYTSKNKNEFSLTRATWINHWGHRPYTLSRHLLEEE